MFQNRRQNDRSDGGGRSRNIKTVGREYLFALAIFSQISTITGVAIGSLEMCNIRTFFTN